MGQPTFCHHDVTEHRFCCHLQFPGKSSTGARADTMHVGREHAPAPSWRTLQQLPFEAGLAL